MHTSQLLFPADFDYAEGSFDDLMPGFDLHDRLAIVVGKAGQSFEATQVLLAAVARYYELLRETGEDFYQYPPFYVIHLGRLRGWHGFLDVWPEHKEVVVEPEPEQVLACINDRAITRLLIPDGPVASAPVLRETVADFTRSVTTVLAYGGDGPLRVRGGEPERSLLRAAIEASPQLEQDLRERLVRRVEEGAEDVCRRVDHHEAIKLLSGQAAQAPTWGFSAEYLAAHGGEQVLARHQTVI